MAGADSSPSVDFAAGVDVNRNNLLLYQTNASGLVSAVWLDNAGQVVSTRDFEIAGFNTYRRGVTALLDGSFVMRRDPGSIRVPALGEEGDVGPAPWWIEHHPGTEGAAEPGDPPQMAQRARERAPSADSRALAPPAPSGLIP